MENSKINDSYSDNDPNANQKNKDLNKENNKEVSPSCPKMIKAKIENHVKKDFSSGQTSKKNLFYIIIFIFFPLLISFILFFTFSPKNKEDSKTLLETEISNPSKKNFKKITEVNFTYKEDENINCKIYDGLDIIEKQLKNGSLITLCESEFSYHKCYKPLKLDSKVMFSGEVICHLRNFEINISNWTPYPKEKVGECKPSNNLVPKLGNNFYNLNCKQEKFILKIKFYEYYYNSFNYFTENDFNKMIKPETLPGLTKGKTLIIIPRTRDIINMYHGMTHLLDILDIIYTLKIEPENAVILFEDSMNLGNKDPYNIFYRELISRGGEPIYLENLSKLQKKTFFVENAVHMPDLNSPFFNWRSDITCKYRARSFQLFYYAVNKYMTFPNFIDKKNIYSEEIFLYPENVKDPLDAKYNKFVTIQWRKVWPPNRKYPRRIMANGKELLKSLAEGMPDNVLVRLVDTAELEITEQIALMKKTDYLVGIHGAGLVLGVFMEDNAVVHEIRIKPGNCGNDLLINLLNRSGRKTFLDFVKGEIKGENRVENYFLDKNDFRDTIIKRMKSIEFI